MDYEQLRRLAQEATPGPCRGDMGDYHCWHFTTADSAFVAAAREAVPALLDERDRLAADLAEVQSALRVVRGHLTHGEWCRSEDGCILSPAIEKAVRVTCRGGRDGN